MVKINLHRGIDTASGQRQYHHGSSYPKRARTALNRGYQYAGRYYNPIVKTAHQYRTAIIGVAAAAGVTYQQAKNIINLSKSAFNYPKNHLNQQFPNSYNPNNVKIPRRK